MHYARQPIPYQPSQHQLSADQLHKIDVTESDGAEMYRDLASQFASCDLCASSIQAYDGPYISSLLPSLCSGPWLLLCNPILSMSKTVKIKPAGSCWCWWADCVNTWGGATSITRSGTLRRPFVVRLQRCFYNLLIYLVLNKTHSVSFHPDHLFFSSMNFMNDKVLLQNNKI